MIYLFVLVVGFFVFEFLGYCVHRFIHTKLASSMYKSHMAHHLDIYPPERFLTFDYVGAGKNNTVFVFLPFGLVLGALIFWLFSTELAILLIIEMAVVSFFNSYIHDATHVKYHWLEKFDWFLRLRDIHRVHHVDMKLNYGIFTFILDRLFKTYKD